jgi:hypothetical protein
MTNATDYELEGLKLYHKDNKSKYDQLMKIMRTMKYKRKYKYDQLMKVMRTIKCKKKYKRSTHGVMRTLKCKRKCKYNRLMKS